jgi:hypothetical protein
MSHISVLASFHVGVSPHSNGEKMSVIHTLTSGVWVSRRIRTSHAETLKHNDANQLWPSRKKLDSMSALATESSVSFSFAPLCCRIVVATSRKLVVKHFFFKKALMPLFKVLKKQKMFSSWKKIDIIKR